jgi:hypothetical protein
MNREESLSSKILTNVNIIAEIYNIIADAGKRAVNSEIVISSANNVNIIKSEITEVNRVTADCRGIRSITHRNNSNSIKKCIKSNNYIIKYDENDIMILGGAALNVYDYLLKDFKHRRGIAAMEEYIKKKTSDIDIAWWPKLTANISNPTKQINDEIVVSSSTAINELVNEFKRELELEFGKKEILDTIKEQIKLYTNNVSDNELKFYIKHLHIYQAGVHKLEVIFSIKNYSINLVDISIHDGGASQRYDSEGNEITDLLPMFMDPVYCTSKQSELNSIISFPVKVKNTDVTIRIPSIYSFIKQQLFAFDNLTRLKNEKSKEKATINLKRVEYIKTLLQNSKEENENALKILDVSPFRRYRENELKEIYKEFDSIYELTRNPKCPVKIKRIMFANRRRIEELIYQYKNATPYGLFTMSDITKPLYSTEEIRNLIEESINIKKRFQTENVKQKNQREKQMSEEEERYRIREEAARKVEEGRSMVQNVRRVPLLHTRSLPQQPLPPLFESTYVYTTNRGIPIYVTPYGINWYIDSTGLLNRLNPFTNMWEQVPLGAPPNYGLPPPRSFAPPIQYMHAQPMSFAPPMQSIQPIQPIQRKSFAPASLRGGRNTISKKRRQNTTMKRD